MLNILNSDLWRVVTSKSPEPLPEKALRELYMQLLGYVTDANEYAMGTSLMIVVSEKTGKWRELIAFDVPSYMGQRYNPEHRAQYEELLKAKYPGWYSTEPLESSEPPKRGTSELDAWVQTHETVLEAFDNPDVRAALRESLSQSKDVYAGDTFLEELAFFCDKALENPKFRI
ncbi:MAG: hypothetical protein RL228_1141 [Actinomycetota bacterium]|jgi:hypothetical protein